MKLVSDKDIRVTTLSGRMTWLRAGEPKELLQEDLINAALGMGARAADAPPAPEPTPEPVDEPDDLHKQVVDAVRTVYETGDRADLASDGTPRMSVLKKLVPEATAELRDAAMREVSQS